MDGGDAGLLAGLEGVVPGEGEGVDVGAVGGDGEAGLDEGQGARVGEERVPPSLEGGRVRERRLLDVGAQVAHRGEVVVGRGRLPLRVGGGDVEAERVASSPVAAATSSPVVAAADAALSPPPAAGLPPAELGKFNYLPLL